MSVKIAVRAWPRSGGGLLRVVVLALPCYLLLYSGELWAYALTVVVPLALGIGLFRSRVVHTAPGVCLGFAALLALYGAGLFLEFSVQGLLHFIGILLPGLVFLLCCRDGPAIVRSPGVIVLIAGAVLALLGVYVTPARINPNALAYLLACLSLIVGLVLTARSDERSGWGGWGDAMFLLAIAIGVVYGTRSVAIAGVLGYAFYRAGAPFLRSRTGVCGLILVIGSGVCLVVILLGTSRFDRVLPVLDDLSERYTGKVLRTGRQYLWSETLIALAESRWLGRGPGGELGRPPTGEDESVGVGPAKRAPSCLTGRNRGLIGDCQALMSARDTLAGNATLWWTYDQPIASWPGVTLGGDPPRVVELALEGRGLRGRIAPELATLDRLVSLRLDDNRLTGSIPPELARLSRLRVLTLGMNDLTGPIPPELGALSGLETLWLGANRLSGPLPPELTQLTALTSLWLDGNSLDGRLPPELAALDRLTVQRLHADPPADCPHAVPSGAREGVPRMSEPVECAPPEDDASRGSEPMTLGSALRRLNNAVDPTPMPRSAHSALINAHNMFLQIGLQMGVAGILAFGFLCASLLFGLRAREGAPVDRTQRFVAACTVAVIVHGTFEVLLLTRTLVFSLFPWMLLGIGMGVVSARRGVAGHAR